MSASAAIGSFRAVEVVNFYVSIASFFGACRVCATIECMGVGEGCEDGKAQCNRYDDPRVCWCACPQLRITAEFAPILARTLTASPRSLIMHAETYLLHVSPVHAMCMQ
jgi:hypothetical protein